MLQSDGARWRVLQQAGFDVSKYRTRGSTLNQWYTSPFAGTALTTGAPASSTLFAMPLIVSGLATIDTLAINVTTLGTAANARVGIYADNGNNYPGVLLVDGGSSSTASTGVKTYSQGLPITLSPGLYWLAYLANGTTNAWQQWHCSSIRSSVQCRSWRARLRARRSSLRPFRRSARSSSASRSGR